MVITDYAGYIWWLSKAGAVTGYTTDCLGAEGGKIDHQGRLIVSCTSGHTVNIYNKGNTTGPADVVLNDTGFYPADAFEDNSGNVFATNLSGRSCNPGCQYYHGDIVWWTTANQSTGSSPSGSYTDPNLLEDFFADVDANGNVYVDGVTCTLVGLYGCAQQGPELDTITNIMGSAPSASNDNISMTFPGGIYALGNGQISVLDQGCSDIGCGSDALYLYASLPGTPASTLYPPQSFQDGCDPISAGYNKADSEVLIGDAGCRAGDLGNVSTKTWKNILNINFGVPVAGAFLKSDK
jgi:hypothetical protein